MSKINSNCEKQIILLMVQHEEKEGQYYFAVKKLSILLKGINLGDFYGLNCLHSSRKESACVSFTKNKERIKTLKKRFIQYIYLSKRIRDKACFQHDMAYGDFKN